MSNSIHDITVNTIEGSPKSLSEYDNQVLLIVNVASYCGYTKQYTALEQLHQKYSPSGFQVLAFPCNDYGAQEPGTNEEIVQFCSTRYSVSFELFDKVHAKGSQQHPLYAKLTQSAVPTGDVAWNFEKFLISKKGEVVARFASGVAPESQEIATAIERELAN